MHVSFVDNAQYHKKLQMKIISKLLSNLTHRMQATFLCGNEKRLMKAKVTQTTTRIIYDDSFPTENSRKQNMTRATKGGYESLKSWPHLENYSAR